MVLIIAEKPSLARNIIAGIDEKMTKRDGYHIGESYIVTWAFGHLFSLADIEHYSEKKTTRWTLENLPCFPEKFEFELRKTDDKSKVDSGVKKQFGIIESLCNRPDVDTIVNAGDADREGEIIVRLCVEKALRTKKIQKRLWLPDQTPETVRRALLEMKDESEYDNLAGEGLARTYIDWLYGVNLTRYATIKTGKLLRVGRVIAPIVRAIYDRDLEIRNFTPEKYFVISSAEETGGEKIELLSKEKFAFDKITNANDLCAKYNSSEAVVTSVTSKKDTIFPGKLYSLSTLQNALGEKYKMSMTESLKIVQKLYEEGYLTYPRTNSEYLATAEKDKMRSILGNIQKLGYPVRFKDSKHIFDDSKIEAHSALTPTYKIPNKEKLSPDESKVYSMVFRRFVAVFCAEECLCEKSEIIIKVGEYEEFTLKGMVILQPGFTKYDDYNKKDKLLPKLSVGDKVNIDFKPQEKQTTPPKHYTITTLNNYLKNPFKEDKAKAKELEETGVVDDADDYKAIFEGLELGTEATRSGIIDNAKKSGYIELKKDVYTILPGGEHFIESLGRLHISMDKYKTSELGKALKRVYRGEMSVRDSVSLAEREIREVFSHSAETENLVVRGVDTGKYGEIVGVCPKCGKNVVRGKTNYGCMGYADGCDFRLGINICKRDIPISEARRLLAEGKTALLDGFISKNFKRFKARLEIKDGAAVFAFENPLPAKPAEKKRATRTKKSTGASKSNKNSPTE
ncbi:MAG: topoisomerase C-terminal repeat-containing protein [Clostridia bacterium]|nr:topoisomerase C-terminal repeat-containing protein [Clostridia bacterium]